MHKKIFAILLILFLLTAILVPIVSADAGDFAGNIDFGGGRSSSGSSSPQNIVAISLPSLNDKSNT